jgi:acylphosphatase
MMSKTGVINRQIFVSGRVQGVFFRESTRLYANELGLAGGVRNLRDGRVEVQVSGDIEKVQSLINWLKIGPKSAKVTTIEVLEIEALEQEAYSRSHDLTGHFVIWSTR